MKRTRNNSSCLRSIVTVAVGSRSCPPAGTVDDTKYKELSDKTSTSALAVNMSINHNRKFNQKQPSNTIFF